MTNTHTFYNNIIIFLYLHQLQKSREWQPKRTIELRLISPSPRITWIPIPICYWYMIRSPVQLTITWHKVTAGWRASSALRHPKQRKVNHDWSMSPCFRWHRALLALPLQQGVILYHVAVGFKRPICFYGNRLYCLTSYTATLDVTHLSGRLPPCLACTRLNSLGLSSENELLLQIRQKVRKHDMIHNRANMPEATKEITDNVYSNQSTYQTGFPLPGW